MMFELYLPDNVLVWHANDKLFCWNVAEWDREVVDSVTDGMKVGIGMAVLFTLLLFTLCCKEVVLFCF